MPVQIYLDHAAATPMDPLVLTAMQPYFTDKFYNQSAKYLAGNAVAKDVAGARGQIAHWLGARPSEIVFTSGGTEANNLAIHGIMRRHPGANIVVSAIEHDSVRIPAQQYDYRQASVQPDGIVDIVALEKSINDKTVLVSVMYANNEIGTIQPIKEIAALISKIQKERMVRNSRPLPLYLHTDACQAANYLDLHISRLGADLMTINAGKIYGPKQCGALYVHAGVDLQPQILGGGQEMGLRSGTEGVANIIGFAKALDITQTTRHDEIKRLQHLQKLFLDLLAKHIPQAGINGSLRNRLPNNMHITIPGQDNERLIFGLDEKGIACAAGSACSASKEESSYVLKSLGLNDEAARSSLRFTFGRQTEADDIRHTVEVLAKLVV
jgi:cysteine desulfurase